MILCYNINMDIIRKLFSLQDLEYKEFHSTLMPTINKERIIGVRVPLLRKLAKELYLSIDIDNFFNKVPHFYYEENNLHAFILDEIKDINTYYEYLELFLPYIDNWATCDMIKGKTIAKDKNRLINNIKHWINSNSTYTIRFGVNMLMKYFLDKDFSEEYLLLVSKINNDDYYVKMVISWYFATSLAKQYDKTIIYLVDNKLSKWIHNKTIQKAIESYRITYEQKYFLKSLKIK